jgi:hypothetical protein
MDNHSQQNMACSLARTIRNGDPDDTEHRSLNSQDLNKDVEEEQEWNINVSSEELDTKI